MPKRVAITGFSFRFPSTDNSRYWQDLLNGQDFVTAVEPQRWSQEPLLHPDKKHPGTSYTFAAGSLGDISTFDAGFFGISPREASLMDPQQRLLLEMSWEAMENSGIKPSSLRGSRCGVFIGIASADYSYRLADDLAAIDSSVATGNTASIAANRISYFFDLCGPSMALDTACSSSMVAFHQAYRSILSGESSQSIAGGISLHLHPYGFITFSKASMLSPQGRCRVFDASGDGYVRSEGGGVFFLKDYDQALNDGNPILAVVANSTINTDGKKTGLTVPSATSQTALLKQAYGDVNIDPAAIDYLEAHGTGTAVGDPIETLAIGEALGQHRPLNSPLLIGSVKSNMGHLETASGVAGLVKALYCIQHRVVPATIGLTKANPRIPFKELNIEVVTTNRSLKKKGKLIVGVNSFGFGGANAHVILESHEPQKKRLHKHPQDTIVPIMLSAKDEVGLKQAAQDFSLFLKNQNEAELYDIAYNAAFARDKHEHRLIVYGDTAASVAEDLSNYGDGLPESSSLKTGVALKTVRGAAFIYSGNGSQWPGMGKQLLAEEPIFRESIREVDDIFRRHASFSLADELAEKNGQERYAYTEIAQPALFAFQVGVTKMLRHRGLYPEAVAGHSVGEVAAAWAAGALTLEAAVEVIFHRSQLQGTTKGKGAMTAIGLGQETAITLLNDLGLSSILTIAGINSSRGVTIAGSTDALTQLETHLSSSKIFQKRLDIDYAFHSLVMDEIEAGVRTALAAVQPGETRVPFYSTVTGKLVNGKELNAEYWWNNIRKPVLFEQAIKHILADGTNVFIEVGPHPVLRSYMKACLKDKAIEGRIVCTAGNRNNAPERVWMAYSQAMLSGARMDWQQIFPSPGHFLQLPNYPWQRERHWHPVTPESFGLLDRHKIHPLLGYALKQHDLTWENQVDTRVCPTLADHVVGEATVLPGTGYAELVLAAALAWHPGELVEIEGLEILSPILLNNEQTKLMRLCIDRQDGSVTIRARDLCSKEGWTLHAVARILREPREFLLDRQEPLLPTRQPDFTGHDHEALTRQAGLMYGPSFQCIDYGWLDGNSARTVFKIPEKIAAELEHFHLHPAILDCTFQVIIQLLQQEMATYEGLTFVPTRMGRIAFRASNSRPSFAQATLVRRAPHSLTAEFTVFDMSGVAIAVVKDARFRSIRLGHNRGEQLSYLDYHGIPKPHAFRSDNKPFIPFKSVQSALSEMAGAIIQTRTHQRYSEEVDPLLDILCTQFTREALEQISLDGRKLSERDVLVFRATNPEIEPFLDHLLAHAEDDQTLLRTADGWEILPNPEEQTTAQDIWHSLVNEYPDFFDIIQPVGRVGMHLGSILAGDLQPEKFSSPDCTLSKLTNQVFGAFSKRSVGSMLKDLIALGLKQLPEGRRLGIVEISQGTPSFAFDACTAIDFTCCDYTFAGTSSEMLETAAPLKERFPRIDTYRIESRSGLPKQAPACDLAIITLDFTTPEEVIDALDFARNCLVPGGSLMVIGHHPSRWIDFVFGARRDHWSPSTIDTWLSNQYSARFRQQQLEQRQFTGIHLIDLCPDTLSGPYLMYGQLAKQSLPASPCPKTMVCSWVLLADKTGFSADLSDSLTKLLQSEGDMVVQACPDDTVSITTLLQETTGSYGQLDGIVYLAGLASHQNNKNARQILDHQVDRCTTAAQIIQACEATGTNTTCWLITKDAATELLPHRLGAKKTKIACIAADAALWGFGRTLINEASTCNVRLVDLETPLALKTLAKALKEELAQSDNEEEIVLTSQGERYVPRLTVEQHLPDATKKVQPLDSPTISLGFDLPGQLRNLRWAASPRRSILDDEVEIEVHATGLNFRDIMYTLGLLPDEAVENGFAGATLGLEFSGIVVTVGSKVPAYAPGDRVVGFGSASFSNRVVTKADAIAHIPAGIAFEAATTIPSTFFTAYYALHYLARLQPGEKVLIHGAAGGVGLAAIQLATWIGAEIYVTAGSDEKRDFLSLLGIEHIYHSRSLSFADEILAQTGGKGIDVVLNSLAGEAINRNFRVLKPFGRFLELGKRDFYENTKIGLRPFRNNISYFGIDADQLMQAQPELTRTLFAEVMALFMENVLHPLPYHVFDAENIVDAFRYMQQSRQIGKIVVTYRNGLSNVPLPVPTGQKHLQLKAEASYLVTGGLGGFGLKTAEWLASKGARNLVLISRSGPQSEEAKSAIDRFKSQGVSVHAASCDVTDQKALSALFTEIAEKLPPLKGIVHAATVINDGLIGNMTGEQIRSVLGPKALGAYYLHDLTIALPLDYFILFSSATTLFGNPGQGNYVAANACLDSLARNRRAAGLVATCVRWGAIDDVGFLARNEKTKEALQHRMGGTATNSAAALAVLEEMLVTDCSGIGVMDFDWQALSRFLPSAGTPKFGELADHGGDIGSNEDYRDTIQQMVEELSDTELIRKIMAILKEEVGEILQVSPEKIEPTRSIYDMGLDSLMGVELVVALESRFGTRMPVMALSQSPTIAKLTEIIIAQLKGNETTGAGADENETLTQAKLLAAQHASDISDDSLTEFADNLHARQTSANDQIIH